MYIPRVGILIRHPAFDLSISNSRRELNHLLVILLTAIYSWGGDVDIFSENINIPALCPNCPQPHSWDLTLIGTLAYQSTVPRAASRYG